MAGAGAGAAARVGAGAAVGASAIPAAKRDESRDPKTHVKVAWPD